MLSLCQAAGERKSQVNSAMCRASDLHTAKSVASQAAVSAKVIGATVGAAVGLCVGAATS